MARSRDGLRKLGPGRWSARITVRDPATGKKALDTTRVIKKDTKPEAMVERARLRAELVGSSDEWTVREAVAAWLPTMPTNTRRVRKGHAARFMALFGDLRLSCVPPAEVQRWLARLPGKDGTANVHRASIGALYTYARSQGRLVGPSPIEQTTRRRTPKSSAQLLAELEAPPPRRALLGDEVPRFFAELERTDPAVVPLARMQLLLGARWAEVVALQWRDVDLQTGVVTILRSALPRGELGPTKGKRRRVAALGAEGLAWLRTHREAMERDQPPGWDVWVFPAPVYATAQRHSATWGYDTVRRRVRAALAAAGIELAAVTHAMRHTHTTIARALEQDAALRASMGHADARQTERYTDDSHRASVARRFAEDFERQLSATSAKDGDPSAGV